MWAPAWRGAPEWTRLRVKKEGDRLPVDALGPAAWMPAADATGALAQARLIVAPGAQAPARYPADEAPPTEAGSLQSREVELRLEVDATARRVEGAQG